MINGLSLLFDDQLMSFFLILSTWIQTLFRKKSIFMFFGRSVIILEICISILNQFNLSWTLKILNTFWYIEIDTQNRKVSFRVEYFEYLWWSNTRMETYFLSFSLLVSLSPSLFVHGYRVDSVLCYTKNIQNFQILKDVSLGYPSRCTKSSQNVQFWIVSSDFEYPLFAISWCLTEVETNQKNEDSTRFGSTLRAVGSVRFGFIFFYSHSVRFDSIQFGFFIRETSISL